MTQYDAAADRATRPLVTVCIPTIGRTTMLEEALESVRTQTYPDLEILLLDNASEGDGRQIMQRFAERDSRARLLRCESRLPMFANFNRGIVAARGEYVTFLFDDDLFRPTLVAREVETLLANPRVGFVGSNYSLIDETGRVISVPGLVSRTEVMPGRDYIAAQVRRATMIIATPGIMFRRNLLVTLPFDESLSVHGGDLIMRLRLAEVADVALIAEPLVSVRVHPAAETAGLSTTEGVVFRTQMLQNYIAEYARRWSDDRGFVGSLRRRLALSHVTVLTWDWIALGDKDEAEQRRLGLGVVRGGSQLAAMLAASERAGLTATKRRELIAPWLRRLGAAVPTPYE